MDERALGKEHRGGRSVGDGDGSSIATTGGDENNVVVGCLKSGVESTHLGRKGLENLLVLSLRGGELVFLFHPFCLLRFLRYTRDRCMMEIGIASVH